MPLKDKNKLYEYQQSYRDKNAELLWGLLNESSCKDCGINDPRVLEFDHLPDYEKKFDISRAISGSTRSWSVIQSEIDKCEVVCANCHRIRTSERGNYKRHQAFVSPVVSTHLKA